MPDLREFKIQNGQRYFSCKENTRIKKTPSVSIVNVFLIFLQEDNACFIVDYKSVHAKTLVELQHISTLRELIFAVFADLGLNRKIKFPQNFSDAKNKG